MAERTVRGWTLVHSGRWPFQLDRGGWLFAASARYARDMAAAEASLPWARLRAEGWRPARCRLTYEVPDHG